MMRKTILNSLVISLATLAASEASAESWAFTRQTPGKPFPTIHVYSDHGTQWDRVGELEAGLEFNIDARGRCEADANTQLSSSLIVSSNAQEVASANLAINTNNRSYGPDHGQGWRTLTFKGPYVQQQTPTSKPADNCNAWAASEAGFAPDPAKRRRELLAAGFTRTMDHAYTARFTLACRRKSAAGFEFLSFPTDDAEVTAKVVCHGNPAALDVPLPPAQRKKVDQGIQEMRLWVNPNKDANFSGFCPKTLHFGGEIDYLLPSNNAVNLSYYYVATSGNRVIKSPKYTTTFNDSGKRILHTWPLGFPLTFDGPAYEANASAGQPDVFGGSVALEFVGAVQIHANLKPAQFKVTCVKKATVAVPLGGGIDQVAAPTTPREIFKPHPAKPDPVKPTPQIPGDNIALVSKPDLVIRSVAQVKGDVRALRVRIVNQGNVPAGAFNVKLFRGVGIDAVGTAAGPIAAHGQQEIIVHSPTSLAGVRPLRLRADDPNRIDESNEGNNSFELAR
jgi:hypothetical protein